MEEQSKVYLILNKDELELLSRVLMSCMPGFVEDEDLVILLYARIKRKLEELST